MPWHRWMDMGDHHWFNGRARHSYIALIFRQMQAALDTPTPDLQAFTAAKKRLTNQDMRVLAEDMSWEELEELSSDTYMLPCGCQDSWGLHHCQAHYGEKVTCKGCPA